MFEPMLLKILGMSTLLQQPKLKLVKVSVSYSKMGKVKSISEVVKFVAKAKNDGRKVSLITGCFDIIHIGHIKLFRFAKRHSDIVVVGLENDKNISLSKGNNRPIHKFKDRAEVLAELSSIDYVFEIKDIVNFGSPNANKTYLSLYKKIQPDFLITNPAADRFWRNKQKNAMEIGAKLLLDRRERLSASTKIIERLEKEF